MGLDWAGTIKYVEQLGGKYAPSITYGTELIELYLNKLLETPADEVLETQLDYSGLLFFCQAEVCFEPTVAVSHRFSIGCCRRSTLQI